MRLAGGPDPVATAAGLPATGQLGTRPAGSDPVTLHAAGSGARRLLAGPVSPGVAYLTMRLAGGTTYRLWPVAWHGHRYVGVVVPWNLPVARFTAYSRHGELAYAIPFPRLNGFPRVVSWLRPGTAVPPVTSATVASGANLRLHTHWSVQVQVGPWGTCLLDNAGYNGTWCRPTVSYPPAAVTLVMSGPSVTERGRDHRPGRRLHPAAAAQRQNHPAARAAHRRPGLLRTVDPHQPGSHLDRLHHHRTPGSQRHRHTRLTPPARPTRHRRP